jgi:small subunit ribosomal protein S13
MIRISGVILDQKKHVSLALQKIYGIGKVTSFYICKKLDLPLNLKVENLTDDIIQKIQKSVLEFEVEGNLRTKVRLDIKRLKDIKCYRGIRHKLNLPVRGQRTKTNAKTRKKRIKKSK